MIQALMTWYLLALTPAAYSGMPTPPVEHDPARHTLRVYEMAINEFIPATSWWTPLECMPGARVKRSEAPHGVHFRCLNAATGEYAGEARYVRYGHRFSCSRKFLLKLAGKTVRDGLSYRHEQGYSWKAMIKRMGQIIIEQKWRYGRLSLVRTYDERRSERFWTYHEGPPFNRPSIYSYRYPDGEALYLEWDKKGRIEMLRQINRDEGLYGRWIVYGPQHDIALFAQCLRTRRVNKDDKKKVREIVWEMPKTVDKKSGMWVSLADAERARTRPCVIDGEAVSPILPSLIPPKPPVYPRQTINYGLTDILHVELPAVAGRPAGPAHILLYTLLKDAGPWQKAAIEALEISFSSLNTTESTDEVMHKAFVELWTAERRADIALSPAHQVELVRRMVQTLKPKYRAQLKAAHGLPADE
jgi:hypothetical protein